MGAKCEELLSRWKRLWAQAPAVSPQAFCAANEELADKLVTGLLVEWEERREQGLEVSAEAMCAECPELLEEFVQGQQALAYFNKLPRSLAEAPVLPAEPLAATSRYCQLTFHRNGGMGVIYRAQDEASGREVAVKVIRAGLGANANDQQRFLTEARTVSQLEHPNIPPFYGFGQDSAGRPFYAMRLFEGDTLGEWIRAFHQPGRQVGRGEFFGSKFLESMRRFAAVCEAIAYAHAPPREVLHCDIKPSNVLLGKYGETVVLDWGLTKPLENEQPVPGFASPLPPGTGGSHPHTGHGFGTWSYMSPEQAVGLWNQVDQASDIYSLGATLYEVLTGHKPAQVLLQTAQGGSRAYDLNGFRAPRQVNPSIPRPLEAVCLKAMRPRSEDRYRTASDLADDVKRWLADEPVSAWPEPWAVKARRWLSRHRTLASVAVSAVLLVAVVILATMTMLLRRTNEQLTASKMEVHAKNEDLSQLNQEVEATKNEVEKRWYGGEMILAFHDYGRPDVGRMKARLDKFGPGTSLGHLRGFEWYHLWRCIHEPYTLPGHKERATCVAFAPGGTLLASGGSDGTVIIRDPATGERLASLPTDRPFVRSIVFSPKGSLMAVVTADARLGLWDVTGTPGKPAKKLAPLQECRVTCAAFTPDGESLVLGGVDGSIWVWDMKGRARLLAKVKEIAGAQVRSIACAPEGKLATGHMDGTVRLWAVAKGKGEERVTLTGHNGSVYTVAFTADGSMLASGGEANDAARTPLPGEVKLWDPANGRETPLAGGHKARVLSVAFAPDGRTLASASADRTVKLWDLHTRHERTTLAGHLDAINAVAFSPDGRTLASASDDKTVKLWNALKEPGRFVLQTKSGVRSLAFTPDGKRLVTGHVDGSVGHWDPDTRNQQDEFKVGRQPTYVAVLPGGRTVAAWKAGKDRQKPPDEIKLCDVAEGHEPVASIPAKGMITCLAFAPNGGVLISGSHDNTVRLWDAVSGKELRALQKEGIVASAALSADGKTLATGRDGTVTLWDVATEQQRAILRGHSTWIWSLAFSPDGRTLAAGSEDGRMTLWDVTTEQERALFQACKSRLLSLVFDPAGKRLAAGHADGTLILWEAATDEEVEATGKVIRVDKNTPLPPRGGV